MFFDQIEKKTEIALVVTNKVYCMVEFLQFYYNLNTHFPRNICIVVLITYYLFLIFAIQQIGIISQSMHFHTDFPILKSNFNAILNHI